jgi:lysophospholipase L1-like esterase
MYKVFLSLILSYSLVSAQDFTAVISSGSAQLEITQADGEISFISKPENDKQNAVSYGRQAIKIAKGANTVSFEVKGDGSDFYASIFLGEGKFLHSAYEAAFSLKNTAWHKVTLPFSYFSRNDKPWNPVKSLGLESTSVNSSKITHLGFGRMYMYSRHNHPNYSFSIRNVKFSAENNSKNMSVRQGLKQSISKIKNKEKINVLLLGDSITHMGKDNNHTYHAFKEMNALGNATIINAAMGGHTSRAANVILSRSLAKMPNPDLTIIFFGANDCKAVQEGNGFTSKVFEKNLLQLIKNVNQRTHGKSEFLLINGVPRVNKADMISTGEVEKITAAYKNIAKEHGLVLCDTIELYNQLPLKDKKAYYRDTVHQSQKGLAFIGKQIAQKLK